MTYSTLLFDFDHTLFDSDTSETNAFAKTLTCCGVADPAAHFATYQRINRTLWSAVERGEMDPGQVHTKRFERLATAIGLDVAPARMAATYGQAMGANGDLYPGARAALEQLRTRAHLAMVTNGISEIQRARIDRLDIANYFDTIVVSSEVGVSKPSKTIFDITFERLGGPDKETAVIIGDSLSSDIQGGRNYGIATCWYNPNRKATETHHTITHQITNLDEIHALVPATSK